MIMREKIGYYGKSVMKKMPEKIKRYGGYVYNVSKTPFNFKKNVNLFKYYTSVGKQEEINYIPPIFGATISTACNLRCPTCLYALKDPDVFRGGRFIKVNDFKSVMGKYARAIEIVWLTGGEPLLHPELDKLVEIVKSKGLSVRISTNGILINKKIGIIKSFDFINVSMDGYNYETFERFRRGTKKQFDNILDGLSLLRKNNLKFMISFIITEENLDEIYEMIKFGYETKPYILNFHNINPHGSKEYTPLTKKSKKVNQILSDIVSKKDYPFDIQLPVIFNTTSKHFKTSKCIQPWYYCCFDDKGNISYCCHLRHKADIGNIFKGYNFNSDKMKNFRRLTINHQYPKEDCLYCQRRFVGEEYGFFNSRLKKWILN
jgi:MoaA/NifB/PqqE/SkfB family radical SAM enzyme